MTIKQTLIDINDIEDELIHRINGCSSFYAAVAWATTCTSVNQLMKNRQCIKKFIIGTHFFQTDPKVLQQLIDLSGVRVASRNSQGTFHPKMYYFEQGNSASLMIGSANLTFYGTTKNAESVVIHEGSKNHQFFKDAKKMINGFWREGTILNEQYVADYTIQHQAMRRHRKALQAPLFKTNKRTATGLGDFLSLPWSEYVKLVKAEKLSRFKERLTLLKTARQWFVQYDRFAKMPAEKRQAIGGGIGIKAQYLHPELGGLDWGFFGTTGSGEFNHLLIQNSALLSQALDCIPLQGVVSKKSYDRFIALFLKAFEERSRVGGVPSATRLLAMKRPDLFLCFNSPNKKGLSKALGCAPTTMDFEKYWFNVVELLQQSTWWNAERPQGIQVDLWDCRMAMVDAVFYSE